MSKFNTASSARAAGCTAKQNSGGGGGAGSTTPTSASFSKYAASPRLGPQTGRIANYHHHSHSHGSSPTKKSTSPAAASNGGNIISLLDSDTDKDEDVTDDEDAPVVVSRKPAKRFGLSIPVPAVSGGGVAAPSFFASTLPPVSTSVARPASTAEPALATASRRAHLQERKASVRKARYEEEAQEMILAEDDSASREEAEEMEEEEEEEDETTDSDAMDEDFKDGVDDGEDSDLTDLDASPQAIVTSRPASLSRSRRKGATAESSPSKKASSSTRDLRHTAAQSGSARSPSAEFMPKVSQGTIKKMRREKRAVERRQQQRQQHKHQQQTRQAFGGSTATGTSSTAAATAALTSALVGTGQSVSRSSAQAARRAKASKSLLLAEQEAFDTDSEPTFTDFFADSTTDGDGGGSSSSEEDTDEDERPVKTSPADSAPSTSISRSEDVGSGRIVLDDAQVQAFLQSALMPAGSDTEMDEDDDDDEDDEEQDDHDPHTRAVSPTLAEAVSPADFSRMNPQQQQQMMHYYEQLHAHAGIPLLVIEETDGRLIRARASGTDAVFGSDGEFEYIGGEEDEDDADDSGRYCFDDSASDDTDDELMLGGGAKEGQDDIDSDDDAYMDSAGNPIFMDAEEAAKAGLLDGSDTEEEEKGDLTVKQKHLSKKDSRRVQQNQHQQHRQRTPFDDSDDGETTDDLAEYDMPFPRLLVGSMAPRGGRASRRARQLARESRKRNKKAAKVARQLALTNGINLPAYTDPSYSAAGMMALLTPKSAPIIADPVLMQNLAASNDGFPFGVRSLSPSTTLSTPVFSNGSLPLGPESVGTPPPQSVGGQSSLSSNGGSPPPAIMPATPAVNQPPPLFNGPRMGTFATSAKSRRRALIDGSGTAPSPFSLPAGKKEGENSAKWAKKTARKQRKQENHSPLARRAKSRKASQDLRRRSHRIREIDIHDLMHQDAWREGATEETRLSSPPRSSSKPKPDSLAVDNANQSVRRPVEYGFDSTRCGAPKTPSASILGTAWPYKYSPRGSNRRAVKAKATKQQSQLASAMPLLQISSPPLEQSKQGNRREQRQQAENQTVESAALNGASTSTSEHTPVVSATAAPSIAFPELSRDEDKLALKPPSSDISTMHFSPLFGGMVPALNMNNEDLDSFTL